MALTGTESPIANAWSATAANVTLSGLNLHNTTHDALGYLCSWVGSSWKCGCRDAACTHTEFQAVGEGELVKERKGKAPSSISAGGFGLESRVRRFLALAGILEAEA
jgi:hypothetical protein